MSRRDRVESKISLNIPGVVAPANTSAAISNLGVSLSNISQDLFAQNAERLKRKGAAAGEIAGNDPDLKLRPADSDQIFNIHFNATAKQQYLANLRIRAGDQLQQIEQDNFNDTEKYLDEAQVFRDATVGNVDPQIAAAAELLIDQQIAGGRARVAQNQFNISRNQRVTDITIDHNIRIDQHYRNVENGIASLETLPDDIEGMDLSEFARATGLGSAPSDNLGEGVIAQIIFEHKQGQAEGLYTTAQSVAFYDNLKYRALQAEGGSQLRQMINAGKTQAEVIEFLQTVANGSAPFMRNQDQLMRARVNDHLVMMHQRMTQSDVAEATARKAQRAQKRTEDVATMNLQLARAMPLIEAAVAANDQEFLSKYLTEVADDLARAVSADPLFFAAAQNIMRKIVDAINNATDKTNELAEAQLVIAEALINPSPSPAPPTPKLIAARETVFDNQIAEGKRRTKDDPELGIVMYGTEQDALEIRKEINRLGVPKAFAAQLASRNKTAEELIWLGKVIGPLWIDNPNANEIKAQFPSENIGFYEVVARQVMSGSSNPDDFRHLVNDPAGKSFEERVLDRLTALDIQIPEGVDPALGIYAWIDSEGLFDTNEADGGLSFPDQAALVSIQEESGFFGVFSDVIDSTFNFFDAMFDGNRIDETLPPGYRETIMSIALQEMMGASANRESLELALERVPDRMKQLGLYGVTWTNGMGRIVKNPGELTNHADFTVVEGMKYARTIVFESGVMRALAPFKTANNIWDGEHFQPYEFLRDGRLEVVSVNNGNYVFKIHNKETGRWKWLTEGPPGEQKNFIFNYAKFVASEGQFIAGADEPLNVEDIAKGKGPDLTIQNMIRESADAAKAATSIPIIQDLIFQQEYFNRLREHGFSFMSEQVGFFTALSNEATKLWSMLKTEAAQLGYELPSPQDVFPPLEPGIDDVSNADLVGPKN